MIYSIKILRKAQKQLLTLPKSDYLRVKDKIKSLAYDPRPSGCKKLTGREAWRVRVGNYRIIYQIDDNELIVTIIKIGHRKDVYD